MEHSLRIPIAVILVLSQVVQVHGQWCTGWGAQTLSLVASTSSVGQITSRFYPSYYTNNLDCTSYLTTSGTKQVLCYVEYKEIEARYDYLKIYTDSVTSSNQLYNSDYDSSPEVYLTTGTTLIASFVTDGSVTYGGYKISYMAVERTTLPSCGSSITATSSYQQLSYVSRSSQSSFCTWTITTDDTTGTYAVQIDILLVQGYVEIEENSATNTYYTANSVYVSGPYPASVEVKGSYGVDFVLQYKQVVSSVTGVVPSTTAGSDNSICSNSYKTSTSTTQYLNSPNYPGIYADDWYCFVTIDAANSSQSVFVNISDYAVATGDALKVYDGSSLSYNFISGDISTGSNYTSSGSSLTLLFVTNDYGQNRGFELTYYSVDRETPVCNQSYSLYANVTSSAVEQTLESPNYPSQYNNYDDIYWLITKPSESDNIVLDFRVFKVEYANDCVYDYVSIYDGACTSDPLLAKVCGYEPVTFEDSTGLYILIHFHTDLSITLNGWELTYYIGEYQDPEAAESTDDSEASVKDFVYPIIGIAVILLIATALFIYLYCNGKGRVGVGDAKQPLKKRTTNDLLTELTRRYGSAEADKQPKIKRKGNKYHPKPNPPGPNTTVINIDEHDPHPPPGDTDPALPPAFVGTGTNMPGENIAPVLTQVPDTKPPAPLPDASSPSMIPPPFPYKTPAEARAEGTYG